MPPTLPCPVLHVGALVAARFLTHFPRLPAPQNRLSQNFASEDSAGYRDCLINLRVHTEETCALGLEGHVCELQV